MQKRIQGITISFAVVSSGKRDALSVSQPTLYANISMTSQYLFLALADSVAVCLLDISELQPFVVQLIDDASEVIPALGNSENEDSFTVFAFNTDAGDVNALGYIVNGTVNKNRLGSSAVFRTLREDVFLHFVRANKVGKQS